jgi:hypothetical protein
VTSLCENSSARGGAARFIYDALTGFWRMVAHEQGGWLTSTISTTAANGGGALTSTTVNSSRYRISGRTLQWSIDVEFVLASGTVTSADLNLPVAGMTTAGIVSAPLMFFSETFYQGRARFTGAGLGYARFDTRNAARVVQNFQGGNNDFEGTLVGDIQ